MIKKVVIKVAKILEKNKIPYMVIGGYASLVYGVIRMTEDIDITLGLNVNEAEKIKALLPLMNVTLLPQVNDDFIKNTFCLVGVEKETGIKVDFIFSFTPYERKAIKRAKRIRIGNHFIRVVSLEDLIIHKIFASRQRDLEDAKVILEKNKDKIDLNYIRRNLKEFSQLNGFKDLTKKFNSLLRKRK